MGTALKKLTPHGHIEERLKTLRKIEDVHVRRVCSRKRLLPADEFDDSGVIFSVFYTCTSKSVTSIY